MRGKDNMEINNYFNSQSKREGAAMDSQKAPTVPVVSLSALRYTPIHRDSVAHAATGGYFLATEKVTKDTPERGEDTQAYPISLLWTLPSGGLRDTL